MSASRYLIFTDLDGTLLDYTSYSFEKAAPALGIISQENIPLVICSSKTRPEIEYYRGKLGNHHPFVSENGGGIFIPKGYFMSARVEGYEEGDYIVVRLGAGYSELRKAIKQLKAEGFDIRGFGDMTAEELMRSANMSLQEAVMAKERDFDEPFVYNGDAGRLPELINSINKKGFMFTQGRFYHILGNSNKGTAVSMLTELYKFEYPGVWTIALGDSPNDIPMLQSVDCPVIVQKHDGSYDRNINVPGMMKADGIGPEGWNRVVISLISNQK